MLPKEPRVSVIMPCFNAVRFVETAVRSVMDQSYPNIELLVVDDGSDDGSSELLGRLADRYDGRINLARNERLGPYPARNRALRQCGGDLVAFLDADDWWSSDAIEKLLESLVRHDADLAYCGWQNVGEGIVSEPYIPPAYETGDPVAHFVRTCPWPIHAALLRRNVAERVGGFSERRFSAMDYDFWLRVLGVTKRMVRVPEVLAFYRWHDEGQVSSIKWRQVLDALDAQKHFINENPQLVAHLSEARLRDLTEGQVRRQAYRAVWRRDLESAQRLFRHVAAHGAFGLSDIRHIGPALLPAKLYRSLMRLRDRRNT